MRTLFAVASVPVVVGCLIALPRTAHAIAMPSGSGTKEEGSGGFQGDIVPGVEVSAGLGSGFSGTYGFGYEARVGYTLPMGVYFGGQVQAFYGQGAEDEKAHAVFFGAEAGYKLFPFNPLELRPYLFLGPAFITEVNNTIPTTTSSKTSFAVQPGALAVYHIGPAFVGADFRFLATPGPFGVTLMGTAGIGL